MMRISMFGLGYVGCVSAACLARDGHTVVGVDVSADKVAALNAGRSPVIEPGLAELTAEMRAAGRLRATADPAEAIAATDLAFICVGTPSADSGGLDLQFVRRVCEQIGAALRAQDAAGTVVVRSTVLPGTTEQVVIPILEAASGKRAGVDFGVCFNPEFLREGTALRDFREPPRTVIGAADPAQGRPLEAVYAGLAAPLVRAPLRVAEMVKYADNAFHGLKVAFANEIGGLCKELGIDSHAVMDVFVLDTKLNLSPAYLRPGYAFGGSCLPKDLRALTQRAAELGLETPLLRAVLTSNERQKRAAFELIRRAGGRRIGVLGLSFKPGTDDLRESPAVELVETLLGKGYQVQVYDRNVSLSALVGSNRAYIQRELPHLAALLSPSLEAVLEHAEVLVVTARDSEVAAALGRLRPEQRVIDLVRVAADDLGLAGRYQGISW